MMLENNKNKTLIIIFLIFVLFLLIILTTALKLNKIKEETEIKNKCFKGIVYNKYSEKNNHGTTFLLIHNGKDTFLVSPFQWAYLHKYVKIGDTLIKPADTLLLYVKKKDGTKRTIVYNEQGYNFLLYFWIIVFSSLCFLCSA